MINLTALKGNNPVGAMAAYGVLSVLHRSGVNARLHFDQISTLASLEMEGNQDRLLYIIKEYLQEHDCAPGFEVPKHGLGILNSPFGPALYKEEKGAISKSVFNRIAGSSNILALARKARQEILQTRKGGKPTEVNIKEAIFGPWMHNDRTSTFGWNSAEKKDKASLPGSIIPKEQKHRTVVAANWLAFEALPLLAPIALVSGKNEWKYPLPNHVNYHEAEALMYGFTGLKDHELKAMGISKYYSRAEYYSQSASCFTPSIRLT